MTEPMGLVTYLDFGPSSAATAIQGLRAWAGLIRAEDGAAEAMLLTEIGRPERFALVETWAEQAQLNAHQASGARLEPPIAASLSAPPDERIGEPFSIGIARPAGPDALYVLVHVDVVPFNLTAVGDWLRAQAEFARSARGALRYEVWRQVDRPNHFTVIQAWGEHAAYTDHVESAATRAFRANLASMKGALYDERLYQRLD
jgi:quinol monooxygenase YgiN